MSELIDKKVEELVEWVAKEVDRHHVGCDIDEECDSQCGKCAALDILSHPDLALIDREDASRSRYWKKSIIPLAEALKER